MALLTSLSDPLRIASLVAGAGMGRVGVTFCPGKQDPGALSGAWARDLDLDLGVIERWNAAALVTLMESHELDHLKVPDLGDQVRGGLGRHAGFSRVCHRRITA